MMPRNKFAGLAYFCQELWKVGILNILLLIDRNVSGVFALELKETSFHLECIGEQ